MHRANLQSDSISIATPPAGSRILLLDVARGAGLVGIALMNVEFFNRPIAELGHGLPADLHGVDWLAGWLIYTFVQGKFWTLFSLLFGMGFAVMLGRAEALGRDFLRPYLRRIFALSLIGAGHFVLIWGGDILFSYALAAGGLLLLFYGDWKVLLLAILALSGASLLPGLEPLRQVALVLFEVAVGALFLRNDDFLMIGGRARPLVAVVLAGAAAAMGLVALEYLTMPGGPMDVRIAASTLGAALLMLAALASRCVAPGTGREWRLGLALYLLPFVLMAANAGATLALTGLGAAQAPPGDEATAAESHPAAIERRVLRYGTYGDAVGLRARSFVDQLPGQAGFAATVAGMFLIGAWFVRSGRIRHSESHLPFFRKLTGYGLLLGTAMSIGSSLIATSSPPGSDGNRYELALALSMLGNLPACLGYFGLITLILHSRSAWPKVALLAPLGRMALTNYLMQSLLGTWFFYGYGLGQWGLARAWQVVFVALVIVVQMGVCNAWLACFNYGPIEWLWRAFTYWQWPPMRRARSLDAPRA